MVCRLQTLYEGVLLCLLVQSVYSQFEADDLIFEAGDLGTLRGRQARTYKTERPFIEFLGIPYAAPTLGENRFLPAPDVPLPLSPVGPDGAFEATRYGPCCPQPGTNILCLFKLGEDCLRLNIYTPYAQNTTEKLLPVIVFIHGGSFTAGSADMYTGARLLERDVVLVNLNYRLGALGFFCLNTDEAPGNAAMYDMVQALRFIKEHIHHFGGDPDMITLTGQSAGSAAVTHLMISPMIKDEELFHRAIALSGSALNEWGTSSAQEAQRASLEVALLLGCYDPARPYAPNEVIECMKLTTTSQLVSAMTAYQLAENREGRLGLGPVTPVVQIAGEEKFLDEQPEAILERNEQADVPLIMGTTRHDGSFVLATVFNRFIRVNNYEEDELFLKNRLVPTLLRALGVEDTAGAVHDALANLYMGRDIKNSGNFTRMIPGLTDLHSVFFFKAAAHRTLQLHSRLNNQTYLYNFDYKGRFSVFNSLVQTAGNPVRGGVGHGDDLLYLFNIPLMFNLPDPDHAVSDRLVDYWVNFAYTGNPNIAGDRDSSYLLEDGGWPAYSEEFPYFAVINAQDEFISGSPSDYWQGVSDDLWPEFQETTTTTTTEATPTEAQTDGSTEGATETAPEERTSTQEAGSSSPTEGATGTTPEERTSTPGAGGSSPTEGATETPPEERTSTQGEEGSSPTEGATETAPEDGTSPQGEGGSSPTDNRPPTTTPASSMQTASVPFLIVFLAILVSHSTI